MPGDWTLSVMGKNGGGPTFTDVPFHALRATKSLEGPGSMDIDLAVPHMDDYWTPGLHRVTLEGPYDWSGYITGLEQSGRPSDGGVYWTAHCLGLGYILDWRLIRQQITFPDTTADDIVFAILEHLQDQYNGDMNFSPGTVNGTCDTLNEEYCFGVVAGDAIREMATEGSGFDWNVNADGELNIWAGGRGTDTGQNMNPNKVTDITVNYDTSDLVTTVSIIGSQTDPFGPIHDVVYDGASTFGRHEIAIDVDADNDQRPRLIKAGKAELKARRGATLNVTATWVANNDGPWEIGEGIGLGDRVDLVLDDWFQGTQTARVVDFSIELDTNAPYDFFMEYGFQGRITDDEIEDVDPDA